MLLFSSVLFLFCFVSNVWMSARSCLFTWSDWATKKEEDVENNNPEAEVMVVDDKKKKTATIGRKKKVAS